MIDRRKGSVAAVKPGVETNAPSDSKPATESRIRLVIPQLPWRSAFLHAFSVLVGVLLAFGIDAWWGYRSDRGREAQYLAAVRAELIGTRQALTEDSQSLTAGVRETSRYLQTVVGGDPRSVSDDSINAMIWSQGPYFVFFPARAAFDDLMNSGGLQLVRSDTLRRALAGYGQALARDMAIQEEGVNSWSNGLAPYYAAHADLQSMLPGGRTSSGVRMPELPFAANRAAFIGNRTYANLLIGGAEGRSDVIRSHELLLERIDEVLEQIAHHDER